MTLSTDSLLKIISSKSNITISYSNRVYANSTVSVERGETTLEVVLSLVFSRFPVEYIERGQKIIVAPKKANFYHVSGFVRDALTGEVLIGANVYDTTLYVGAVSNDYGFFSLNLPEGRLQLRSSFVGYRQLTQTLELQRDTFVNVRLSPSIMISEIEVASDVSKFSRAKTGTVDLPVEQVKNMPMLLGASDIIKALQMTPGVQCGEEGLGGMSVRGGSVDENIVLLDDVPLYSPNHLLGLFTVFNSEGINSATLIKSGFPARYGGRMSSVLDVKTNEGNLQNFSGYVNVSPLEASALLEGPIVDNKVSFTVSARRTYFDMFAAMFQRKNETKYNFYFYDITSKLNWIISSKDRIYVSFFTARDQFTNNYNYRDVAIDYGENDFRQVTIYDGQRVYWGNLLTSARWNHIFGNSLFMNMTASFSHYRFNNKTTTNATDDATLQYDQRYYSGVNDFGAKADFHWYTPFMPSSVAGGMILRFGASYTHLNFFPGITIYATNETAETDSLSEKKSAKFASEVSVLNSARNEVHAYVEDEFSVGIFSANLGLHLSYFDRGSNNPYVRLEPRILLGVDPVKHVRINASYSDMSQSMQLLRMAQIESPADMWLPVSTSSPLPHCWQLSGEVIYNFWKDFAISAEYYYKKVYNKQTYKSQAMLTLFASNDWETLYCSGEGKAQGLELFLHKKTGKISGWVGYTLSRSINRFEEIDDGRWYPSDFDHRHTASIFAMYKVREHIDISASWSYRTGAVFTLSTSRYTVENPDGTTHEFSIDGRHNAYQMSPSHMLNLGVNIRKSRPRTERVLSFGVYNVYGRKNPMFVYWAQNSTEAGEQQVQTYKLKQFSLVAWPWPYIKYSIKF